MDGAEDPTANATLASANLQKSFANIAMPALRRGISSILSDLGDPGTEPASVRTQYATARNQTIADFDTAQKRASAGAIQEMKQSGGQFSTGAQSEILGSTARAIDRQRGQSLRALDLSEAQAGMDQSAFLLSAASQAGGAAASGALGFGQNAISAGQIQAQQNRQNAQMGSTYGGMIGTILGAALSAYTGGLSIPLGSAAGSAIGGWIGSGG